MRHRAGRIDRGAQPVRIGCRQQLLDRYLDVILIADEACRGPIGEPARLDLEMQPLGAVRLQRAESAKPESTFSMISAVMP